MKFPVDSECMREERLRRLLSAHGQEHLLRHWGRLDRQQRAHLEQDILQVDWQQVSDAYRTSVLGEGRRDQENETMEPLPPELHQGVNSCSPEQLRRYREAGLQAVREGRVAALLLAGGQGTRLGVAHPKGMFQVGLPSGKSLYQLQGERILKLQQLAAGDSEEMPRIPWYIMTSEHTLEPTAEFFAIHGHFGLRPHDVVLFEQLMLPCVTAEGKAMLEEPHRIARAPDGNGGLFRALQEQGVLTEMRERGVQWIHVYCVDNILVKVADPTFVGYCMEKDAQCAAKVVERVSPDEAVGVVCRVGGRFQVVEYSEISPEDASKRTSSGRLEFNAGNICNHVFHIDFLQQIGSGSKCLRYHVAKKKISFIGDDGSTVVPLKPNGIKLEKFVFDVFEFSEKFVAWEVERDAEFSPLKNADGCPKDTPTTARHALYAHHRKLIVKAGGAFATSNGMVNGGAHGGDSENEDGKCNGIVDEEACEISPLLSYAGEDLEKYVKGKVFSGRVLLKADSENVQNGV